MNLDKVIGPLIDRKLRYLEDEFRHLENEIQMEFISCKLDAIINENFYKKIDEICKLYMDNNLKPLTKDQPTQKDQENAVIDQGHEYIPVFEMRLEEFESYLEEKEQAGDFDRMNIVIKKEEMLVELQKRNRVLFSISLSTFEAFLKKAKKRIPFSSKYGARPKKNQ